MYKVIFCGTPQISLQALKGLEELNVEIVGIITQPDKPQGRKKEITFSPVKRYALEKNYKIFQPTKIKEILDQLKKLNPDFLLTCAYGQIIPQSVLDVFKNCINVHASLLPKYRGGSPVQYAIMNGEKETGISLMQMIMKMDAGQVYWQEKVAIDINDNNEVVFEKLGILAKKIIKEKLYDVFENKLTGEEQNQEEVTFAYNLKNDQEFIDWNKSAFEVHNFIRALSPHPIAFTFINNERVKIKTSGLVDDDELLVINFKNYQNGQIIKIDKEGILVNTGQGFIKILELQREGKKMVPAWTFKGQNSFINENDCFVNEL